MSKRTDNSNAFADGNAGERPECLTDEHLKFLDDLRESGATNMFGARPYLLDEFSELSDKEAASVLGYWIKTFEERHNVPE